MFEGLKVTKAMVIRIAMTKGLNQMRKEMDRAEPDEMQRFYDSWQRMSLSIAK